MVMRILFFLLACFLGLEVSHAQSFDYRSGAFALGLRTTGNMFTDDGMRGLGAGGEFKLGISNRVNTEWFWDYIASRGENTSFRNDNHIGWSVQFALPKSGFNAGQFTPYILGGQCFDLTQVGQWDGPKSPWVFSAAAQAGLGLSRFVGSRMELNLQLQYMIHLGKHLHLDPDDVSGYTIARGADFKGHLLGNFSMNFYLFHLWKK